MSDFVLKTFLATISKLVRGRGGYPEAITHATSIKDRINAVCSTHSAALIAKTDELDKMAFTAETVMQHSLLHHEIETLNRQLLQEHIDLAAISDVIAELKALYEYSHSIATRAKIDVPATGNLRAKVQQVLCDIVALLVDDNSDHRHVKHSSKPEKTEIDVRGDGACGWRAFLTSLLRLVAGLNLSYDPAGMPEAILMVKHLLLELVQILASNPENRDFITALYNIPQNGVCGTFAAYSSKILVPTYFATNFELRLLCMLFEMIDPVYGQVNVFHKKVHFGEQFQCISASGRVVPLQQDQIHILQVPGHFKSIMWIDPREFATLNTMVQHMQDIEHALVL